MIPSEKPFYMEADSAEGLDEDEPMFDELRMFERAAASLHLIYPAEIANLAQAGDVIEILDTEHNQLYRSFSFFSFCNYSLTDLNNYSLLELYEPDPEIFPELKKLHEQVLHGDKSVLPLEDTLREYYVNERLTPERCGFWVKERCLLRALNPNTGEKFIVRVRHVRNGDEA